MTEEKNLQVQDPPEQEQSEQPKGSFDGRRYVGTKETFGFVLFDSGAGGVRINPDHGEFLDRTLSIDRGLRAGLGPLIAIWDGINDLITATFIDKTRTRWGKFRPYLVLFPVYGIPIAAAFFFLPYIFWGTEATYFPKIVTWFVMSLFHDFTETIKGIARTGIVANLTPNPNERLSLITKGAFFSMLGQDFPTQLLNILRDIISNSRTATPAQIELNMRTLFLVFGVGTLIIFGAFSLYFAKISKERVTDTGEWREKTPSVRDTLRALRGNRPLLMLMLDDALSGITINGQMGLYTRSILNFVNFQTISGIPGGPVSFASYAYIPRLRKRFSSRTLWIVQSTINVPLHIGVFLFGIGRSRSPATVERLRYRNPATYAQLRYRDPGALNAGIVRNFFRIGPMLAAFGIQNTLDMFTFGIGRVIPDELRNETIDYGEWKNGFRSEGMTGALRSLPRKFTNMIGNALTDLIISRIGFKHGEEFLNQTYDTAVWIFALATLIPAAMRLVSLAPKILYNINQKDREAMYIELAARRAAADEVAQTMKEIEGEA